MSNKTNDYNIGPLEIFQHLNGSNKFGIRIPFKRDNVGISNILMCYHVICCNFVFLSGGNFLFEPRDTNRQCMLVAFILVLATFYSAAQVKLILIVLIIRLQDHSHCGVVCGPQPPNHNFPTIHFNLFYQIFGQKNFF